MPEATLSLRKKLARQAPVDKYLVWCVLILAAAGVVAVYSAVSFLAQTKADGDTERFLLRHLWRLALAFGLIGFFSFIDYHVLARFSRAALLTAIALLIIVKLSGATFGGATRWLRVGAFGFQPSDLAKVALILYTGVLLAKKQAYIKSFSRAFAPLFLWILGTVAMIGMENLSTAVVLLGASILMCFIGRVNVLHLGGLFAVGMALAFILLLFSPGRAARVESYLGAKIFPHTNAEEIFSTQDEGYQAQQSRIAFAMGGLTGVGPGKSIQRDFLPAPYNDFIFAIIAEEYGIAGALGVLGFFVLLLFRGFIRVARRAPDPLGLFLAVGITTTVVLYAFVHAGVASGLLPVTGLPLPFVSYGGTSLVASGLMIGILLNVSRQVQSAPGAA